MKYVVILEDVSINEYAGNTRLNSCLGIYSSEEDALNKVNECIEKLKEKYTDGLTRVSIFHIEDICDVDKEKDYGKCITAKVETERDSLPYSNLYNNTYSYNSYHRNWEAVKEFNYMILYTNTEE